MKTRGFTLIELVVAISVLGILIALAVPSLRDMILNSRRSAAVNEIVTALQTARGEALKRGQTTTVCPSSNPNAATPTCLALAPGTATSWTAGWLTYINLDNSSAGAEPDAGETVIKATANDSSGMTISTADTVGNFSYRPFNVNSTAGTVTICDSRGDSQRRAIVVATTGRPRVSTTDGSACP